VDRQRCSACVLVRVAGGKVVPWARILRSIEVKRRIPSRTVGRLPTAGWPNHDH